MMHRVAAAVLLVLPVLAGDDLTALRQAMRRDLALPSGAMRQRADDPTIEAPPELMNGETFARLLAAQRADGSWPDIVYEGGRRGYWPAFAHVRRLLGFAQYAAVDTSPHAAAARAALHQGLAWWSAHDFKNPNWWYNEIGVPKSLGAIAIALGPDLRPEEHAYIANTVLARSGFRMTGQNRVWMAGNMLMRGVLLTNKAWVGQAAQVFAEELQVTASEGIQADWSFHQHGPQQQFGNYGLAFARDLTEWAGVLRDTRWALPADRIETLRNYLLEGQAWVAWRGWYDMSSVGRQLGRGGQRQRVLGLGRILTRFAGIDEAAAPACRAFVARNQPDGANDLSGFRMFWRSDFAVLRGPDLFASLKMSSRRTIGAESLNEENLSGFHLADGALLVRRDGDEYADVAPVWNWRGVPGVTCEQVPADPPRFGTVRVETDFAGGASDGTNGCAGLAIRRGGLRADKAWFFLGDEIVCLGAGITSTGTSPIATAVNQCRLDGPVTRGDGFLEHDGLRYTFPPGVTPRLTAGPQTGSWSRVERGGSDDTNAIVMDIFHLALDHGVRPGGASYAWTVTHAGRTPRTRALVNTTNVQAVQTGPRSVQAVFREPATLALPWGGTLAVDAPCALLLEVTDRTVLRLADPTHRNASIRVSLDDRAFDVALPGDLHAGATTAYRPPR